MRNSGMDPDDLQLGFQGDFLINRPDNILLSEIVMSLKKNHFGFRSSGTPDGIKE